MVLKIVASTGKNLLLLDLGLALAFPTIIIPVLRGLQKDRYPNETIYMSAEAASWYGKCLFFFKTWHLEIDINIFEIIPVQEASLTLLNPLEAQCLVGLRNRLGVNEPWYLLICLTLLLGLCCIMQIQQKKCLWLQYCWVLVSVSWRHRSWLMSEKYGRTRLCWSLLIYYIIGVICSQPKIRGILVACSGVAVMLGVFLMYLLGTLMDWRNVALTCLFLPIIALTVICFVGGFEQHNYYPLKQYIIFHKAARDAIMASLERTTRRCRKIVTMASWMGIGSSSCHRV